MDQDLSETSNYSIISTFHNVNKSTQVIINLSLTRILPKRSTVLVRWMVLLVVALLEILGFTYTYDTFRLEAHGSLALELLRRSEILAGLLVISCAILIMAVLPKLRGFLTVASARSRRQRFWWIYLVGHFVAFALFITLANWIFLQNVTSNGGVIALVWAASYLLCGFAATVLLAIAATPLNVWQVALKHSHREVSLALLAGIASVIVGKVTKLGWDGLATYTFHVVEWLLTLIYPVVISRPEDKFVGTPVFAETIAPACSGYEGIGLILVFFTVFLWLFRGQLRFPRAMLLIPVGCITIWLANCVRIALLIIVGDKISPEVAVGGFHSQTGWLFFCIIALGLAIIGLKVTWFSAPQEQTDQYKIRNPSVPYLMPFLVLVAGIMITGMASDQFDWLYPARIMATAVTLWYFFRILPQWEWSWIAILAGILTYLLWIALESPNPAVGQKLESEVDALGSGWAMVWTVCRCIGSVLIVPVTEELAFRGYLMRRITTRDFEILSPKRVSWTALMLSSILFGLMHQRWFAGALAGLIYGLVYQRRGNLADPIVAHVVTNGLIACQVLIFGAWHLWA